MPEFKCLLGAGSGRGEESWVPRGTFFGISIWKTSLFGVNYNYELQYLATISTLNVNLNIHRTESIMYNKQSKEHENLKCYVKVSYNKMLITKLIYQKLIWGLKKASYTIYTFLTFSIDTILWKYSTVPCNHLTSPCSPV